jgi:hypothetical protein
MKRRLLAFFGVLAVGVSSAWAVLGESVRTVADDQHRLHGQLLSMARPGYSIQQISSPSGHVIKEYVSTEGTVFGVSWRGPTVPDLRPLLGSYFAELQAAAPPRPRRRGPLAVRTERVVIENGGHQRAFYGRAYVPGLVPAGVSPEVVQ